jgi:diguanylate cyclase (GGDEF)-like protein
VIASGLGLLVAVTPAARWPEAQATLLMLVLATLAASVFVSPTLLDTLTFGPAVIGAMVTLYGAPVAALLAAAGTLVGQAVVRRQPVARALFGAAQWSIGTLAAGVVAFLVNFDAPSWAHPLYTGKLGQPYIIATLAAGGVLVVIAGIILSGRHAFDDKARMPGAFTPLLVLLTLIAFAQFTTGAFAALLAMNAAPASWLPWAALTLVVGGVLIALAEQRMTALELDTLQAVTPDLGRASTMEELIGAIGQALDRVVLPDIFVIYLKDTRSGADRVAHYRGPGGIELARHLQPDPLAAHALRTGKAQRAARFTPDVRRSVEVVFGRGSALSGLGVPITIGTEISGAITLFKAVRGHFTARHARFVAALADQAGLAVRNGRLLEALHQHRERLSSFQQFGFLPGALLDPDQAAQVLATRAAQVIGAKYAFLALAVDPHDKTATALRGAAVHGTEGGEFLQTRIPVVGESQAMHEMGRAFRDRQPVVYDEGQIKAARFATLRELPDARVAVTVPMNRPTRSVGALTVVRTVLEPFSAVELEALQTFADQGAVVIESAWKHSGTEAAAQRGRAIVGALRRMATANEVRDAFRLAADVLMDVLGIGRCVLVLDAVADGSEVQGIGLSSGFLSAARPHLHAFLKRQRAQSAPLIVVPDLATDTRTQALHPAAAQQGLRSAAFALLRVHESAVGVLAVFPDTLEPLTNAESVSLLEAVADVLALHAAAGVLRDDNARWRRERAELAKIFSTVGTLPRLADVFQSAATELGRSLQNPRVAVYRVDGAWLRRVAQAPGADAPLEMSATSGRLGKIVRDGAGLDEDVIDLREDRDYVATSFEVLSLAVAPVTRDGATDSLILVEGTPAVPVTRQTLEFVRAFAQQLGVAIRNAISYEEQQREHDELEVLYEAAKAISGTLDLRTALDSLVAATCRAFAYDNGALFLVDQESGDLTVEAAYGYREPVIGKRQLSTTGIPGAVARTGEPIRDGPSHPQFRPLDERTASELAVPLIAEGKVLGVFDLGSARPDAFSHRDVHLLRTLAAYAVVAIQNARLFEQASRMAITDGLTELYNHRHLHDSLERVLERARRDGSPIGLIMLEIDHFKRYNDTYGHRSGDEALRMVARLLRRGSRPSDIVARYGGDEFMVILPGATKAATQETAERMRRAVEAYPLILGDEVITTITLSVGVAAHPQDGSTVDGLVESVDRAQYIAKRSGGNKVHVAHSA